MTSKGQSVTVSCIHGGVISGSLRGSRKEANTRSMSPGTVNSDSIAGNGTPALQSPAQTGPSVGGGAYASIWPWSEPSPFTATQ